MSIESAFLSRLRAKIKEQKDNSTEVVMSGRCQDHATYRYSCGYYKALLDIETISNDILSDLQQG